MFNLTFYAMPLFFRHQKDSGSWSIYKGENFFNEICILVNILWIKNMFLEYGLNLAEKSSKAQPFQIKNGPFGFSSPKLLIWNKECFIFLNPFLLNLTTMCGTCFSPQRIFTTREFILQRQ